MTGIQVVDFRSPDAPRAFAESLRETGFGVISHHPICQELIEENYRIWGEFFHSQEKHQYPFDPVTHTGFISTELSEVAKGYQKKDLKEFYHLYEAKDCPAELAEKTMQLKTQLTKLGETLLTWVQDNSPQQITDQLESPLTSFVENSPLNLFRLIHYPPLTGNEPDGAVRAAEHGDINFLTLLPAATAEGLQAKMTNGEWVDVPINPNWIVVNTGDMLEECTQHYYPSTRHRVLNPTGEAAKQSRLSMPLFLHARNEVRLSDRYPTARAYRIERYGELGLDEQQKARN